MEWNLTSHATDAVGRDLARARAYEKDPIRAAAAPDAHLMKGVDWSGMRLALEIELIARLPQPPRPGDVLEWKQPWGLPPILWRLRPDCLIESRDTQWTEQEKPWQLLHGNDPRECLSTWLEKWATGGSKVRLILADGPPFKTRTILEGKKPDLLPPP